jgi:hypothetical protein
MGLLQVPLCFLLSALACSFNNGGCCETRERHVCRQCGRQRSTFTSRDQEVRLHGALIHVLLGIEQGFGGGLRQRQGQRVPVDCPSSRRAEPLRGQKARR